MLTRPAQQKRREHGHSAGFQALASRGRRLAAPLTLLLGIFALLSQPGFVRPALAQATCAGPMTPVSPALNDLGPLEYVRMVDGPTGSFGGLYPDGENTRPTEHEQAGIALAGQVIPLNGIGDPDPESGKIVLISLGMSNTSQEFVEFMKLAEANPRVNDYVVIVNGASGGLTAEKWANPGHVAWDLLDDSLAAAGVTAAQVQVAWNKHALVGTGDFPAKAEQLQYYLEQTARNLHDRFPNLKLAYYTSRTRAYAYWAGLSPEPIAMETGFAVKWMIEAQILGDPDLNYDPTVGPVRAPFLSWGSYLWADGTNPRSDGFTWLAEDLVADCIHPSTSGRVKVAHLLLAFFKSDTTTAPWFLAPPVQHLPAIRHTGPAQKEAWAFALPDQPTALPALLLLAGGGLAAYFGKRRIHPGG